MKSERHHYLSQAFLDGFTDANGSIWMFDRKANEIRQTAPRVVACKNDLYAFTDHQGKVNRDVERTVFGMVDGPIGPILKKLEICQHVSNDELIQLALFAGFLRVRTPAGMDEIEQAFTALLNKTNPCLSEEYVEARIDASESADGQPFGLTAQEIVEMFSSGKYELGPQWGHVVGMMCEMGLTLANHIRELDWTLLIAADGRQFVVSDHPFVIVPPPGHAAEISGVGLKTHGAVKYVALTARLCLRLGDIGAAVKYRRADSTEIRRINVWTAVNSERFIFCGSEALLRRIAELAELQTGVNRREVVTREAQHISDPNRSLLHLYTRTKIGRD